MQHAFLETYNKTLNRSNGAHCIHTRGTVIITSDKNFVTAIVTLFSLQGLDGGTVSRSGLRAASLVSRQPHLHGSSGKDQIRVPHHYGGGEEMSCDTARRSILHITQVIFHTKRMNNEASSQLQIQLGTQF